MRIGRRELGAIAWTKGNWILSEPIADEEAFELKNARFQGKRGLVYQLFQRGSERSYGVGVVALFVEKDGERFGLARVQPDIDLHASDGSNDR